MKKYIFLTLFLLIANISYAQTWGRYDWIKPSDLNDGTEIPQTDECVAIDSSDITKFQYKSCGGGAGSLDVQLITTSVCTGSSCDTLNFSNDFDASEGATGTADISLTNVTLDSLTTTLATVDTLTMNGIINLYDDDGIGLIDGTGGKLAWDKDALATNHGALAFGDGTSLTYIFGILGSSTPTDGYSPKVNAGIVTWQPDDNTAAITGADTCVIFMDGTDTPACDTAIFNYNKITGALSANSFISAPSANPTVTFQDSDVGDGGTQGLISLDCPKTGSGAEGCEMTFSHQVAGVTVDTLIIGNSGGVTLDTVLYMKEQADADADVAGYGQLWVNTAVPNELWFTNDAGTDTQLGTVGSTNTDHIELPVQSTKLTGTFITAGARIDGGDGNWRLLFDASSTESGVWQFRMPSTYSSTLVAKLQYSMVSATSGKVDWEVDVQAVADGEAVNTASFDTTNEVTGGTTVPGTAGLLDSISITLTNDDSVAAGELVYIRINRDHDDADDTATGDAELVGVTIEWTE